MFLHWLNILYIWTLASLLILVAKFLSKQSTHEPFIKSTDVLSQWVHQTPESGTPLRVGTVPQIRLTWHSLNHKKQPLRKERNEGSICLSPLNRSPKLTFVDIATTSSLFVSQKFCTSLAARSCLFGVAFYLLY